jgi:hypothetical protein
MNGGRGQFFGRNTIINRIGRSAGAPRPESFVVVGARLTGKSALLRALRTTPVGADARSASSAPHQHSALIDCGALPDEAAFWVALSTQWAPIQAPRQPVQLQTGGAELFDPHLLQQIAFSGSTQERPLLLIDNFDQLLARIPEPLTFCTLLQQLAVAATVVLTVSQPLYDRWPMLAAHELTATLAPLFLTLLDSQAADCWLAGYSAQWPPLAESQPVLRQLTGCHPFLLHKLRDSLEEVQQMLPPGQPLGTLHLPLVRLRLAEYGRLLFLAQTEALQTAALGDARTLVGQLQKHPVAASAVSAEQLPALNWLINQALVRYYEDEGTVSYALYSSLFAEFLQRPAAPSVVSASVPVTRTEPLAELPLYDDLTKIEATLLRYFFNHREMVIPTEQLLREVWKRPRASNRRVQEAIRRLRLQLERQRPPIGQIRNERGRGYRFIPATQT